MFYMNYHVLHMSIYNVMHENAVLNGGLSCFVLSIFWLMVAPKRVLGICCVNKFQVQHMYQPFLSIMLA